jgi:hypothetical protein
MIGFIDALYSTIRTKINYSSLDISTFYSSLSHTLMSSVYQSPLSVSWQRIYNSLSVTSIHTWSFLFATWLFSCRFFWIIFDYHLPQIWLQLPSPELNPILILAEWDPRYIAAGRTHRKHRFLYCCVMIHCCRDVFTAQLRSKERGEDSLRTPFATPFLLLNDVTAYVTLSSAACVRAGT